MGDSSEVYDFSGILYSSLSVQRFSRSWMFGSAHKNLEQRSKLKSITGDDDAWALEQYNMSIRSPTA